MCYSKPGPRCSGHTRTNFRKATENLRAAAADLKEKHQALETAQDAEAKAALEASVKAHAAAEADLADAEEKYRVSKEQRAEAMKAWREAKSEYDASPAGIKRNRIRSADTSLTAEQRAEARQAAVKGAQLRADRKQAYKEHTEKMTAAELAAAEEADILRVAKEKIGDQAGEPHLLKSAIHHERNRRRDIKNADSDQPILRATAAGNFQLPPAILTKLSKDPSTLVRREVAINTNTPAEVRDALKGDPDTDVRHGVASWTKTPAVLDHLSNDKYVKVRNTVATNRRTPVETLWRMASNSNESVSVRNQAYLSLPEEKRWDFCEQQLGLKGMAYDITPYIRR